VISYRALDRCGIPPQVSDRVISYRALDCCGIPPQVPDRVISNRALDCCGIPPQVSDRVISNRALDCCGIPPQVSDRVISYRALDCCGIPPQVSDRVISHRALDRCGIPPQVSDRVISHRALDRCGGWPRSLAVGDRGAMDASARKRLLLENPAGSSQHPTQKPGRNQCFSGKGPSRNGRPTRDVETGRGSGLLIAGPSPFQPPRRVAPVPRSWGPGSDGCFSQKKITPRKPRTVRSASCPKNPVEISVFQAKPPQGTAVPRGTWKPGAGPGCSLQDRLRSNPRVRAVAGSRRCAASGPSHTLACIMHERVFCRHLQGFVGPFAGS